MTARISGSLRFSVESMLYYAPRITDIGVQLAAAQAAAQRQLLGLRDFWGSSSPDRPFAETYQASQYAALLLARQLAIEIQGVGGGIRLMAANFGITEITNTADLLRIVQNEDVVTTLLDLNGGVGAPPDRPVDLPVFQPPGYHPTPTPEPNASPGAAGAAPGQSPRHAPAATASPSATPPPAGPPLPHPEPGPAPPTSWQIASGSSLIGPAPSGSPASLDEAADCWNTLMLALDDAWAGLKRNADYIVADAEGAAADAFSTYVDGLTSPANGSLTRAIEVCQYLQDGCRAQASSVRNTTRAMEQAVIELIATFVIGAIVSFIAFPTGAALTDAVAGGIVALIDSIVDGCLAESEAIASVLETTGPIIAKVLAGAAGGAYAGATYGIVDTTVNNSIAQAFGKSPTLGTAALRSILEDTLQGAVGGSDLTHGAFSTSSGVLSDYLTNLGERGGSPSLLAIGRQLKSGTLTISAANTVISQLVAPGKVNPVLLVSGTVGFRLGAALGPNPGKHAAANGW